MRSPKTKTLFFLAAALFLLAAISIPTFYPAPIPVLNPDGTRLLKADGTPVVHRDMTQYYRYNAPAFIFLTCSGGLFVWWAIRVVRRLYGRVSNETNSS